MPTGRYVCLGLSFGSVVKEIGFHSVSIKRLAASFCVLLLFLLGSSANAQLPPIGGWKYHLPWKLATSIAAGEGKVWLGTEGGVMQYDRADGELRGLTRVEGLSGAAVSYLAYAPDNKTLVIGYRTGAIDLFTPASGTLKAVVGLRDFITPQDKAIRHILISGSKAYLSTGIGISVLDIGRGEIGDTYVIGSAGNNLAVNAITQNATTFFAATDSGIKQASRTAANLLDFQSWTIVPSLPTTRSNSLTWFGDSLYIASQGLLLGWKDGGVSASTPNNNFPITRVESQGDVMTYHAGFATILHGLGRSTRETVPVQSGISESPVHTILDETGKRWVGDRQGGLVRVLDGYVVNYVLNGPANNSAFRLRSAPSGVYITAGGINRTESFAPVFNTGIHRYANQSWTTFESNGWDTLRALSDVAISPLNGDIWAASYSFGLIHANADGVILEVFNDKNSPLKRQTGNSVVLIGGLQFDSNGDLWGLNSGTTQPLFVKRLDGTWQFFSLNGASEAGYLFVDSRNFKWVIPRGGGMFVMNAVNDLKSLSTAGGQGALPASDVYCVAEDRDGFIWIGTGAGVGVFYVPEALFDPLVGTGADAQRPRVELNGFVGFLFGSEAVLAIEPDAGNRKYIGTASGFYLVSADGTQNLQAFNTANSPLPSNNVTGIVVQPETGEVLIATDAGIVSFRGEATLGYKTGDSIRVFPNPVRADFDGPIAIAGLPDQAYVKITDLAGHLLFQTQALGGQAIWNGSAPDGRPASDGVYTVWAAESEGAYKARGKIVLLRKRP
jgi:ligand-binding sensor domain-containing protein